MSDISKDLQDLREKNTQLEAKKRNAQNSKIRRENKRKYE